MASAISSNALRQTAPISSCQASPSVLARVSTRGFTHRFEMFGLNDKNGVGSLQIGQLVRKIIGSEVLDDCLHRGHEPHPLSPERPR